MSNYTILLIDYEPRSVESLSRPLEAAGYRIVTASDGVEGIDVFNRVKPDLVLIEAMIPKKHGFEVCQTLRNTEHGGSVPIAILTAVYKGRKYRHQAIHNYKCNEYLEKPVGDDVLVETVQRMLQGREPARVDVEPRRSRSEPAEAVARELAQTTEAEIMERLDAILPGLGGNEADGIEVAPTPEPAGDPSEDIDEARIDAAFDALEHGGGATESAPAPKEEPEQREGPVEASPREPAEDEAPEEMETATEEENPDLESVESLPLATAEPDSEGEDPRDPEDREDEEDERSAQVVSFDPDRARRRRGEAVEPAGPTGARPAASHGSAAAQPVVEEPEREEAEPEPSEEAVAEVGTDTPSEQQRPAEEPPKKRAEPNPAPARVEKSGGPKLPAWVWVAAAAVLLGASAGAFFMFRGEPEPVRVAGRSVAPAIDEGVVPETPPAIDADAMVGTTEPVEDASAPAIDLSTTKPEPEPAAAQPPRVESRPAKPVEKPSPPARKPAETKPKPVVETKPEPRTTPPAPVVAEPEPQPEPQPVPTQPASSTPETVAETEPAASEPEPASTPLAAAAEPATEIDPPVIELENPPALEAEPAPPPAPVVERGQLMDLGEVDVAPRIVDRVMPEYTLRAQKFRQEGTVELNVLIDENGKVAEVEVISGIPRSDLNDSAVKAVKAWTYAPATKDGVSVKVWKSERIVFKR